MQNKDSKPQPPPIPTEKKFAEPSQATPPWGSIAAPYPSYPRPASPVMPGVPAPQRPGRASTMQYGNAGGAEGTTGESAAALLAVSPGLKTAVRTDLKGSVLDVAGQGDAESLCAVAAMVQGALSESEELFGLGELQAWSLSTAELAVFAFRHEGRMMAASGEPSKSPEGVLRRILASVPEGRGR